MPAETRIVTLENNYHVWTRRVGLGKVKILLLHGGPGMTHEYLEPFTAYVKKHPEVEVIYYDQLGSYFSDQPNDPSLWTIDRFLREIEEVRKAWHLDQFYLYGQSWGGTLALEYAASAYGRHLKGLIDSNMVDNYADYAKYINKYRETMDPADVKYMKEIEAKGNFDDHHYNELLGKLYQRCICRLKPWPDAVKRTFEHLNEQVYVTLQGPTEFTITGSLKNWNIRDRLKNIKIPALVLGGKYDSMNPEEIKALAKRLPNGQAHICPNGSHFSIFDDQKDYFSAISKFINEVEK
ncbi:proline iminopeptidase-family hydrolase [Lactobacillus acetotolerans]|jgi:proline iminopeptidase|uniref:Proline iminopeptidase n=1 Tax=Lactobacillus acetotolerans TaxID=1600 RepID=A0A0D6A1W9_9LACO|nr:proline iminopeptidase-family hydrolase [Lactobacillus acetotolerans]KRN39513.1 prolyl aminopeptidase [Lactobacillus acetotolerans DSM 20749 = JCM 3825]MBN7277169.1 proline iminopeptidase-family hydrolase [Lactobacillus acetotolerans]QFG50790.1 alpha/beta fold hydrolase [Lactobacillus acetotolerans]QJD72617.1 proline iminopeptidase-family hydrolase [Lactobacillus acetotolerans]BAQ56659.1 prolyl aminopeptidase [Lactobacillus acetotolerans]